VYFVCVGVRACCLAFVCLYVRFVDYGSYLTLLIAALLYTQTNISVSASMSVSVSVLLPVSM